VQFRQPFRSKTLFLLLPLCTSVLEDDGSGWRVWINTRRALPDFSSTATALGWAMSMVHGRASGAGEINSA